MKKSHWIIIGVVVILFSLAGGYLYLQKTLNTPIMTDERMEELKISALAQNETAFLQPLFQPAKYYEKDPMKNAYFGELHTHTSLSFDSYIFGNRLTIDQSYHFAKGEVLENPVGEVMQLSRPLDFTAITDHAETFGLHEGCADLEKTKATAELCDRFENPDISFFIELRNIGEQRPPIDPTIALVNNKEKSLLFSNQTWSDTVRIADEHNDPGKFTAFVGYEYSPPLPDSGKNHRNVIFKNSNVPDHAFSMFDALSEINLWKLLNDNCKEPCEFLTIPHNPNLSWGLSFASHTIDGDAYTIDDWKQRDKFEPIVEMYQIKGNSECSIGFGTTDEQCNFEQFFDRCKEGEETKCIHPTSMARDGLKKGLNLENELGFNPLDFGMIGSTDTHNSNPGDTEEWDFRGSAGAFTATAENRLKDGPRSALIRNPGGLAVIWAEENTRDALFESMQNKEVYATSGTRIELRFFGSFNYQNDLAELDEPIQIAYRDGYPMGSTIDNVADQSPTFFVLANKDPMDAPLDKIQIIKGWTENGETREQVIDLICSEGREINKNTNLCDPIDAKVDLSNCKIDYNRGAKELKAIWEDKNYNAKQNAFYYVRVIQNPTCRWSTYDSLRVGQEPPKDYDATITEMAWSSPIWISN